MQVSNKLKVAIEILVDMAKQEENDRITIKGVADKETSSRRYLEMIFADLKKAGIVNSIKGYGGGYYLAKQASEITIAELYRIFEGDFALIGESEIAEQPLKTTLDQQLWTPLAAALRAAAEHINLQQLVDAYKAEITGSYTYYI